MIKAISFLLALEFVVASRTLAASEAAKLDEVTREQAALEQKQLQAGEPHSHVDAMAAFRKTAEKVEYQSGELALPGFIYKPSGAGPFPAIIWNHGSEKDPRAQAELGRFYTSQGFVFFVPIRHGHTPAPCAYIGDLQESLKSSEPTLEAVQQKIVGLHELYNQDVVAAVGWLKRQPFVEGNAVVMSGVSYGGIQTMLAAEKGLGVRAFVAFSPAAMSFANGAFRARLVLAARNAKAPIFLLQAKNDYSIGPSELLAPILKQNGPPSRSKVYEAFGTTNSHGHGAFACWSLGATIWGPDVLEFIDAAMKVPPAETQ